MSNVTLADVRGMLMDAAHRRNIERQYGELASAIFVIREQIRDYFQNRSRRNSYASVYLQIFDMLCLGIEPVGIATKLNVTRQQVHKMLKELRKCPAMQTLHARLEGSPN